MKQPNIESTKKYLFFAVFDLIKFHQKQIKHQGTKHTSS